MKSRWFYVLVSVFVFVALFPGADRSVAQGSAFYVATNGDDDGPGSLAQPWRTVCHAVQMAQAGDTVYIRAGVYTESNLMNVGEGHSGFEGHPITFRNYPGETPVIDAGITPEQVPALGLDGPHIPAFYIQGKHYIVLDGLTIQHGWRSNINIADDYQSTHITIQNCDIRDFYTASNSAQIFMDDSGGGPDDVHSGADFILIRNNRLHGYIPHPDPNYNRHASGILTEFCRSVTIANNEIYDLLRGIYYKHEWDNHVTTIIENNLIHDCTSDGMLFSKSDAIIRNNVFRDIHNPATGAAVAIWLYDGSPAIAEMFQTRRNQLVHNSIVDCDQGIYLKLDDPEDEVGAFDTVIRDNLIYNFTFREYRGIVVWPYNATIDTSNTTIDHNLVYSPRTDFSLDTLPVNVVGALYPVTDLPDSILNRTGNIQQAPVFVNYAGDDFVLADGSPGKNAASDGTDVGANMGLVGIQLLALRGAPTDRAIHLNWMVSAALPVTATWRVTYYTQTTSVYTATDPYSATRSLVLTEHVQNYQWYAVTLSTVGVTPELSDTVLVMPTDIFTYLPLIRRGE